MKFDEEGFQKKKAEVLDWIRENSPASAYDIETKCNITSKHVRNINSTKGEQASPITELAREGKITYDNKMEKWFIIA